MHFVATAWPLRRKLLGAAALLAFGAALGATVPGATPQAADKPPLPAPPASGELGYVVTEFHFAIQPGMENCPDGLAASSRDNFLNSLPEAERTRLLLKENEVEMTRRLDAAVRGPDRTNICTNPELFPRPDIAPLKGRQASGMNLDGDSSGNPAEGCAHENFTGLDGAAGVDNQSYRVLGCSRLWRSADGGPTVEIVSGYNKTLATGEHTQVLLLRGVDSLRNDPEVEVTWANSDDRPVLDSKRNFVTGASFTVHSNPRWRNALKGRIRNGVLETQPGDITLTRRSGVGGLRGERAEWGLRQGRLRLAFQPDGSVRGIVAAYVSPRDVMGQALFGGTGAALTAGIDCAAQYHTLVRHADGIKDPATGKCTALSTTLNVAGVPAFVNDRPGSDAGRVATQ